MAVLLPVLILAACSAGGGNKTTTTSAASTTSPTSPTFPSPVGNVTDVLLPQAFLDGVKAHQGDGIRAQQTLSTDSGGAADFSLNRKISSCRLLENSAAQPQPAGVPRPRVRRTPL